MNQEERSTAVVFKSMRSICKNCGHRLGGHSDIAFKCPIRDMRGDVIGYHPASFFCIETKETKDD